MNKKRIILLFVLVLQLMVLGQVKLPQGGLLDKGKKGKMAAPATQRSGIYNSLNEQVRNNNSEARNGAQRQKELERKKKETIEDFVRKNSSYSVFANESSCEVWDKTTYLNVSLINTKLSSDEFPSSVVPIHDEFNCKFGLGIKMGKTFKFHKQPIGSVMFVGFDYNWMDLNFNTYKAVDFPGEIVLNEDDEDLGYGKDLNYMPWHNKKNTLDYGMSIGPSIAFYPLTSLGNEYTDKLSLNLFFHVGYDIGVAFVKNVGAEGEDSGKLEYAFGHGLFTSFGASLNWDFVGLGFDIRNDRNIKFMNINKDYGSGTIKLKQRATRIYIQFRF